LVKLERIRRVSNEEVVDGNIVNTTCPSTAGNRRLSVLDANPCLTRTIRILGPDDKGQTYLHVDTVAHVGLHSGVDSGDSQIFDVHVFNDIFLVLVLAKRSKRET
jgi:hypothetical protein